MTNDWSSTFPPFLSSLSNQLGGCFNEFFHRTIVFYLHNYYNYHSISFKVAYRIIWRKQNSFIFIHILQDFYLVGSVFSASFGLHSFKSLSREWNNYLMWRPLVTRLLCLILCLILIPIFFAEVKAKVPTPKGVLVGLQFAHDLNTTFRPNKSTTSDVMVQCSCISVLQSYTW